MSLAISSSVANIVLFSAKTFLTRICVQGKLKNAKSSFRVYTNLYTSWERISSPTWVKFFICLMTTFKFMFHFGDKMSYFFICCRYDLSQLFCNFFSKFILLKIIRNVRMNNFPFSFGVKKTLMAGLIRPGADAPKWIILSMCLIAWELIEWTILTFVESA